jgi:hypothetical protein
MNTNGWGYLLYGSVALLVVVIIIICYNQYTSLTAQLKNLQTLNDQLITLNTIAKQNLLTDTQLNASLQAQLSSKSADLTKALTITIPELNKQIAAGNTEITEMKARTIVALSIIELVNTIKNQYTNSVSDLSLRITIFNMFDSLLDALKLVAIYGCVALQRFTMIFKSLIGDTIHISKFSSMCKIQIPTSSISITGVDKFDAVATNGVKVANELLRVTSDTVCKNGVFDPTKMVNMLAIFTTYVCNNDNSLYMLFVMLFDSILKLYVSMLSGGSADTGNYIQYEVDIMSNWNQMQSINDQEFIDMMANNGTPPLMTLRAGKRINPPLSDSEKVAITNYMKQNKITGYHYPYEQEVGFRKVNDNSGYIITINSFGDYSSPIGPLHTSDNIHFYT